MDILLVRRCVGVAMHTINFWSVTGLFPEIITDSLIRGIIDKSGRLTAGVGE